MFCRLTRVVAVDRQQQTACVIPEVNSGGVTLQQTARLLRDKLDQLGRVKAAPAVDRSCLFEARVDRWAVFRSIAGHGERLYRACPSMISRVRDERERRLNLLLLRARLTPGMLPAMVALLLFYLALLLGAAVAVGLRALLYNQ
jgi:hypothetical protein